MHNLIKNNYIKGIIRFLKENEIYNEKTQNRLTHELKEILKYPNIAFYPHVLFSHLLDHNHNKFILYEKYIKEYFLYYLNDIKKISKSKLSNKDEIYKLLINMNIYNALRNYITENETHNGNYVFYPELIKK